MEARLPQRHLFSPKLSLMHVILRLRVVDSPPIWMTPRFLQCNVLKQNKWPVECTKACKLV